MPQRSSSFSSGKYISYISATTNGSLLAPAIKQRRTSDYYNFSRRAAMFCFIAINIGELIKKRRGSTAQMVVYKSCRQETVFSCFCRAHFLKARGWVSAIRPRGQASSALPTQDGLGLNQEELSLEARPSLPCCTVWLPLKAIAPCSTKRSLSLNRCWTACFGGNKDFLSRIFFLLLEAQIRVDTTYYWVNDGIANVQRK